MRTSLQWAVLLVAVAGSSYLSHRYWPSRAEASPASAAGRCSAPPEDAAAPATWRSEGFRDDERCDRFGDPPGCY